MDSSDPISDSFALFIEWVLPLLYVPLLPHLCPFLKGTRGVPWPFIPRPFGSSFVP